jgi:hypothetical protein
MRLTGEDVRRGARCLTGAAVAGRFFLIFVTALNLQMSSASATSNPARAPEFELKDQYGQALAYRFPARQVSVLIFGDREGAGQIEGWVRPLYERYGERVSIRGVAVLSSVPAFMRPVVRGIFKSRVKYPVLLDWRGDVTKSYGYESKRANVFVIGTDGAIILKLVGAASGEGLRQVQARLDGLLGGAPAAQAPKASPPPAAAQAGRKK